MLLNSSDQRWDCTRVLSTIPKSLFVYWTLKEGTRAAMVEKVSRPSVEPMKPPDKTFQVLKMPLPSLKSSTTSNCSADQVSTRREMLNEIKNHAPFDPDSPALVSAKRRIRQPAFDHLATWARLRTESCALNGAQGATVEHELRIRIRSLLRRRALRLPAGFVPL